jgi:glycosyltransferase involved in cell wall biosynthesis
MDLIYLVAVGALEPRFIQAVEDCVGSLRRFGRFDGDIVVVTDCAEEAFSTALRREVMLLHVPEHELRDPAHGRVGIQRYLAARLRFPDLFDARAYEQVMYLDCDILAVRDLAPLFSDRDHFRYACEFQSMNAVGFNGCLSVGEWQEARLRRGINSGTFVVPAHYLAECLHAWQSVLDALPHALGYDQPALNAVVLRRLIRAQPLPYFSVAYPLLANFAAHYRPQARLLHFCGGVDRKFARMHQQYEDLLAGRPVRVEVPSTPTPPPAAPAGRRYRIAFTTEPVGIECHALINREWRRELSRRGHSFIRVEGAGAAPPDFVIHHDYLCDFLAPLPSTAGKLVAVRSFDFGPYPVAWANRINEVYDQFWVHSRWTRDLAHESGIDPARVRRIPDGFDPAVFHPDGPTYDLPTNKRFRFLFVGGAVLRKGIDILLQAYRAAFTPEDDVVLVIKDAAEANVFYNERPYHDEIRRAANDPSAPSLLYLAEHLAPEQLAALYRACDCAVFPYRAEGFVMPALEAVACGTPTIVPDLGPSRDYSDHDTSFLVRSTRIRLPLGRRFTTRLGFQIELPSVDFCEVQPRALQGVLRAAYEATPAERRTKGTVGAERAHAAFTWKHVTDLIEWSLAQLDDGTAPVRCRS